MSLISNEINRQLRIKVVLQGIKVVTKSLQTRYRVVLKSLNAYKTLTENLLLLSYGFGWRAIPIRAPDLSAISCQ